jgi:DNA-binding NarL/FixJ family response regulator
MVLDGLEAMLSTDDRLEVVGRSSSVDEFRRLLPSWRPDVVVTDYQLLDGDGVDVTEITASTVPDCAVLMISGHDNDTIVSRAVQAGCSGFLAKGMAATDLADAVVAVSRGATVFPAASLRVGSDADLTAIGETLTPRELEVLQRLADALTVAEIASEFFVSEHTVRNHVRSILSKLHARSQLQAVVTALQAGLIEIR